MRFLRLNALSIAFGLLFIAALVFQAIAGHADFNEEQRQHHASEVGFSRYLTSASFGVAVLENWQSEYLQFALFILATIWLVQRGSTESKELGREGHESEAAQKLGQHAERESPLSARTGGGRRVLYSNSLLIVMTLIFLGSWLAQSITDGPSTATAAWSTRWTRSSGWSTSASPTSGSARCRTGSQSSSLSARLRFCRSTCDSAAPRSRSR